MVKVELKWAVAAELIAHDPVLAAAPVTRYLTKEIVAGAALRRFNDKAVLMQQGEAGHSLFLVMAGDVRLFARRDHDSAELGVAHRGAIFGEAEALEGKGGRRRWPWRTGRSTCSRLSGRLLPSRATCRARWLRCCARRTRIV